MNTIVVYAKIELDTDTCVDMTPSGLVDNLGEIIQRALEPLVDVTVSTFEPRPDTVLGRSLAAVFE